MRTCAFCCVPATVFAMVSPVTVLANALSAIVVANVLPVVAFANVLRVDDCVCERVACYRPCKRVAWNRTDEPYQCYKGALLG